MMAELMKSSIRPKCGDMAGRPAFTLVEMLVAVGLVVLMMTLFAEVFTIATGSMSKQKGIAANDQSARMVETLLRNDLEQRTFSRLVPYEAGELRASSSSFNSFDDRMGYFYISENSITDDSDDVLQFTIQSTTDRYYARGAVLTGTGYSQYIANPNQPDFDDSSATSDNTASSDLAEVSWFLRNGTLYRRLLLIRRPYTGSAGDAQPMHSDGTEFFNPTSTHNYTGNFYTDFDYSAHYSSADNAAKFHSVDSLDADKPAPLGDPINRFGHSPANGNPREYTSNAASAVYFGRFTHQETSDSKFKYPHSATTATGFTNGNPFDFINNTLTYANGVVTTYPNGSRIAQDVVLNNVHSFDVKIWDEWMRQFVDVGHAETFNGKPGDFAKHSTTASLNRDRQLGASPSVTYGPRSAQANNRVFDTWNPAATIGTGNSPPPYRPMKYYPSPMEASNLPWTAMTPYTAGATPSVVFPSYDNQYLRAYVCTTAGTSGSMEPIWATEGAVVADGTVVWQRVDNIKPVRAISISVRFYDASSDQMRQITVTRSLVN